MSAFPFLTDLAESHLIPSRSLLKQWKITKLADLCYLYFIALVILLNHPATKKWARDYCKATGEPNDFRAWRTDGNDLYAMLYALSGDETAKGDADKLEISPSLIRHWLRRTSDDAEDTHRFLMRIDSMFRIGNSTMKSLRRSITDWDDTDQTERHDVVIKLIQLIHERAPSSSELLPQLKKLASDLHESASAGATGVASVATAVGGLGTGFDPDGQDKSIYSKKKPAIIRRSANLLQ